MNLLKLLFPDRKDSISGTNQTVVEKIKNDLTRDNIKGNVKKITETQVEGSNKSEESELKIITITLFNQKGNIMELNYSFAHPLRNKAYKKIYNYDFKNNKIEMKEFTKNGDLDGTQSYKSDSKGNIIKVLDYEPDGNLSFETKIKYNLQNNISEVHAFNSNGNLMCKEVYKYNAEGRNIEKSTLGSNSSSNNKITYKYDNEGNVIEMNRYDSNGKIESTIIYEYEFDIITNWIKKKTFEKKILEYTTERVIEYY